MYVVLIFANLNIYDIYARDFRDLFKKLMEMENGIKFLKGEIWQYFYRFLSINLLENWRFRKPVERVIGLGAAGL